MIPPNITHASCDLEQQQDRAVARRERLARAVALRSGRVGPLGRLLRRPTSEPPSADAARPGPAEDVLHALRDC